jgi:hypothetical protein
LHSTICVLLCRHKTKKAKQKLTTINQTFSKFATHRQDTPPYFLNPQKMHLSSVVMSFPQQADTGDCGSLVVLQKKRHNSKQALFTPEVCSIQSLIAAQHPRSQWLRISATGTTAAWR